MPSYNRLMKQALVAAPITIAVLIIGHLMGQW